MTYVPPAEVVAGMQERHFRTVTRRWDSRVLLRVGKLIPVPPEISDKDVDRYTAELTSTLDRVCEFAKSNVSKAGTNEFPYYSREQEAKQ